LQLALTEIRYTSPTDGWENTEKRCHWKHVAMQNAQASASNNN
jgi:hypothetical protein